jgi:hypothetical protein
MIDVNYELQDTLELVNLKIKGCTVVYGFPKVIAQTPCISFYEITENPTYSFDDEEYSTAYYQIDIFAAKKTMPTKIAIEIDKLLTAADWVREMSMDMPNDNNDFYRKTMRYRKIINDSEY